MSAKSLNRYTPVPAISPKQPHDEKTMSSSKAEKIPSQPSDMNVSGSTGVVIKPPIVKRQSSVTAKVVAAGNTKKQDSEGDSKANCSQVEAQCNGEAEKEVTSPETADAAEHQQVQNQEESALLPEDKNDSSAVNENDADDSDDNDDQLDNTKCSTSVFHDVTRRMLRLYQNDIINEQTVEDLEFIDRMITDQKIRLQIASRVLNLGIMELCQYICRKKLFRKKFFDEMDKGLQIGTRAVLACLGCAVNLTDISKDACRRVVEIGFHEAMFSFLNLESMDPSKVKFRYIHSALADSAMSVVYNVIQVATEVRELYREQDAVQILQKFRTNTSGTVSCLALILQAYVINDEENDLLDSVQFSFSFLSRELRYALKSDNHRSPDGYKATEILAAINKLGVNDDNKSKIVASGALASYVELLGSCCSSDEQFLSAQGLWTLAMKCPDEVHQQDNCVTALKNVFETSDNDDVRRQARGTLDALGVAVKTMSATVRRLNNLTSSSHPAATSGVCGAIFISYNHGSKSTVLKIRDRLRAAGYSVWVDEDDVYCSIADDIINGLDRSSVVLVCLSQKYHESPYCRKEVVYAAESHKEIIPLMMEPRYKPHGWLKFYMGDRLRRDFSNDDMFHDAMKRLLDALQKFFSSSTTAAHVDEANGRLRQTSVVHEGGAVSQLVTSDAADVGHRSYLSRREASSVDNTTLSWTSAEVMGWLERSRLQHLRDWFKDFDGEMLMEYKMMRLESPETFAACVQHELTAGRLTMTDVLRLNRALKLL